MTSGLEFIEADGQTLAIIIYASFNNPGIEFFTPSSFSQQLAYMHHPAGKVIEAHVHNPVTRTVQFTQETLFIRRGRIRADFFDEARNYLESRVLGQGDVIMLICGGHGFEVLEEIEMIEVKQGPYAEGRDKTRFQGISAKQAIIKDRTV